MEPLVLVAVALGLLVIAGAFSFIRSRIEPRDDDFNLSAVNIIEALDEAPQTHWSMQDRMFVEEWNTTTFDEIRVDPTDYPRAAAETQDAVAALRRRLELIEERFPSLSEIDKVTSVNDAVMATRLEACERALERLDRRLNDTPDKWDVVTIVVVVIGALGAIFGIIRSLSG